MEELNKLWLAQRRSRLIHPGPIFIEDRLEVGAQQILAYVVEGEWRPAVLLFEDGAERALARLSAAYLKSVPPNAMDALQDAAGLWARGEKFAAHVRLTHAGLGPFENRSAAAYRLFLADYLLDQRHMAPCALLKAMDLGPLSRCVATKFNPAQPRVPRGCGDTSGQWTCGPDEGSARVVPVQEFLIDPEELPDAPIRPEQFAPWMYAKFPATVDPPLSEYPTDSTVPPRPGLLWESQEGAPVGSSRGAWTDPTTKEAFHPDFDHRPPIEPHWDWTRPWGRGTYRWFPDGRMELAKVLTRIAMQAYFARSVGEYGRAYIIDGLNGFRGLAAMMKERIARQGACYGILPESVSDKEACEFDYLIRVEHDDSSEWLQKHLSTRVAEGKAGVVVIQDLWTQHYPQTLALPRGQWFEWEKAIYLWAEFGPNCELDFLEFEQDATSFQYAVFIIDDPHAAAALRAGDRNMTKLASQVTETFMTAYDRDSYVMWQKDEIVL